jgi:maleate isomerase
VVRGDARRWCDGPDDPARPVRAFAKPPHGDDAVELLAAAPLHAIAFGFTSSAYVLGAVLEQAMTQRLQLRADGLPLVTPAVAPVTALRAFHVERVALVDPPWFDAAFNELGRSYFRAAGFDVVFAASRFPPVPSPPPDAPISATRAAAAALR